MMKKFININKWPILLIILFLVMGIVYIPSISLQVYADGNEYLLMSVSYQNHLSFGVTEEDLEEAHRQFYNHSTYFQTVYNGMHPYKDARYCNHFGIYSALVMPVKLILISLNIYPLWAFVITNYLLWLAALLVILFKLNCDIRRKTLLIALMIINPVFFYLDWAHTEVFMFSFIVIGLVAYYNKHYGRAILFLSIAGMQNVAICPFAMMIGIDYIISRVNKFSETNGHFHLLPFVKQNWIKIVPYGFLYIPSLLPIIDTYTKFGTFSLVADVARENKYLLKKAYDLVFDLNLGILPYEPIILIAFIVMVVVGLIRRSRIVVINMLGLAGMLYVFSNQLQINCGMQFIMRYNIWIIPILIFYVVMQWNIDHKNNEIFLYGICLTEIALSSMVICYLTWGGGAFTAQQFAPWTKLVLDKNPALYNPTHGIFMTRTLGVETYSTDKPVIYASKDGYIRKILVNSEDMDKGIPHLIDFSTREVFDLSREKHNAVDEGDYQYINLHGKIGKVVEYTVGKEILLYSENANSTEYIQDGISVNEGWGTWTDGDEVHMMLLIQKPDDSSVIKGYIDVLDTYYHPQTVIIYVNNVEVYNNVHSGDQDIEFTFENTADGIADIRILLPDSIEPCCVDSGTTDNRDLGLALASIVFS